MANRDPASPALPSLSGFLTASCSPIVITDALAPDNPIVFANPAFERITGYAQAEVVGRNCRLLQGEDRDQPGRAVIRNAIAHGRPCECELRNYRKNGEMFWNKLYLFPLTGDSGRVAHFAGIQHDISREKAAVDNLERERRHMARLSQDLIYAQENERKALARELHDEFAQRLTALKLVLHRALPLFEAGGAKALWRQAEEDLASMVGLVRDISGALRPPSLDYFGLEATVRQMLARLFENGPAWVFEYAGLPPRLPPLIEISLFRIIQEGVTNILRHARATQVVVEINSGDRGDELELIVRDNGIGFDAARWREQGAGSQRAGLAGIGERVQLLGGRFDVRSSPGKGTSITATFPFALRDASAGA